MDWTSWWCHQKKEYAMKSKSTSHLIFILLAMTLALFSFTACNDNPNAPLKRAAHPPERKTSKASGWFTNSATIHNKKNSPV